MENIPLRITGYASERHASEPIDLLTSWGGLGISLSRVQETKCGDSCPGKTCADKATIAWSPVYLKKDQRHRLNTSVEAITVLVFDLDDVDPIVFDQWYADFQAKRLDFILHPTHRHMREGKCCWRLVIRISREVKPEEWSRFWASAVVEFALPPGVDRTCKDPSRLYYRPTAPRGKAVPVQFGEGGCADVDYLLAKAPAPPPRPQVHASILTPAVLGSDVVVEDDGTELSELRKKLVELRKRKASSLDPADRKRYLIYTALINGTALAVPGDYEGATELPKGRGSTVNQAASMLAFAFPGLSWDIAVEILRPAILAMDCEPQGADYWLGPEQAEASYNRAMDRALQFQQELAQRKQAEANVLDALSAYATPIAPAKAPSLVTPFGVPNPSLIPTATPGSPFSTPSSPPASDGFFAGLAAVASSGVSTLAVSGTDDQTWTDLLVKSANQQIKACGHNIYVIMKHSPILRGTIKFNVVTRAVEIHGGPFAGVGLEVIATKIMNWLLSVCRIEVSKVDVEHQLYLTAYENQYDPIRDYLLSVVWDGQNRLDRLFIDYAKARVVNDRGEDISRHVTRIGRKFMISAVARGLNPGEKVDNMLVMEGNEGLGKTSWLKVLFCPWYIDTKVNAADKDAEMLGGTNWCVELGELVVAKHSDEDVFKQYLTKTHDKYRPPYGRHHVEHARRCIYVGTTNNEYWLKPGLGKRRFWPVWIESVDLEKTKEDKDQLFAEAVARYQGYVDRETGEKVAPERWHLVGDERLDANDEAASREKRTYTEEKISEWWYRQKSPRPEYVTNITLVEIVLGLTVDKAITNTKLDVEIRNAMKSLGFGSKRMPIGGGSRPHVWVPSKELREAVGEAPYLQGLPGGAGVTAGGTGAWTGPVQAAGPVMSQNSTQAAVQAITEARTRR